MSAAALEQIAKEVAVCTKCSLCKTRLRTVPGEGSSRARLLFIGEAPGYHEDQQGRPFVGQSGQLLDKLLGAIEIPREDVFIGNVVKCRPPGNADPTPDQIAACKPYLDRQIAALDPRLIVTLGRFSMARYWPGQRISQIHGQPKQENGRLVMAMFHPAAALRDRGRTMAMFKEDGLTIPALLEKADEIARAELWGLAVPEPGNEPTSQPVLAETAPPPPPRLAEASARSVYPAQSDVTETQIPAEPLPGPVLTVAAVAEGVEMPEGSAVLVPGANPETAAVVVKTVRPRKPKAVPVAEETGLLTAGPVAAKSSPKPAGQGRKKRPPVDGEQLRMF